MDVRMSLNPLQENVRSEAKILNPIYYNTETYVAADQEKVTPDALSEGKKKIKGTLTIDTSKNISTTSDQIDDRKLISEKETSEPGDTIPTSEGSEEGAAPTSMDEGLIFTTRKKKYEKYLEEYRLNSIIYLLQPGLKRDPNNPHKSLTGIGSSTIKTEKDCAARLQKNRKELRKFFMPMRNKAVIMLKKRIIDLLTVYQLKNTYDMDLNEMKKVPHHLFSWSFKDFLKRRRLKNTQYIDKFMAEVLSYDVNTLKLINDIKEAKRLINILFECEESEKRNKQALIKAMAPELSSIQSLINIENKLITVIEAYISAEENDKCILEYLRNSTNDTKDEQKMSLEMQLIDVQLWNPIELRYTLNWIQAKHDQCEMKSKDLEDNLTKQIQKDAYEHELFQMTAKSTIDASTTLIEVLKIKINDMTNKYQVDYDAIDNKNVYLQKRVDFFESEMKNLSLEIERFHVEIEAMQQKLAEEERRRLEKEVVKEPAPKKGKKKSGKGKGKGAKSNTDNKKNKKKK